MGSVLIKSIESFPPFEKSVQDINALCSMEDIDFHAVASVIESDPLLYADILHFTNAPQYGLRLPITSIYQAILLLGVQRVRGMTLQAALKAHSFVDLSPYSISSDRWFETMSLQQRFLTEWIIRLDRTLFIKLGVVIYILEIGRLIASYSLHFTKRLHHFDNLTPNVLLSDEEKVIGKSGDELAALLFKQWHYEALIIDLIENSMSPEKSKFPKLAAMLTCARTLFTLEGTCSLETIEPILQEYGFDLEPIRSAYESLQNQE